MFEEFEVPLRNEIRKAESPVLGLLGTLMPSGARSAIEADLRATPGPKAFSQRLERYPALFGVWLAEHVMNGLGQDGHFSLYPHLQNALRIKAELTLGERELLWRSFRRAMFRLGIQPLSRSSGTHYMADEYVRQAGVPIAFADDLAVKMLQLARRIGVPDEDDQDGLLSWQSTLLNKLGLPFSQTARKAVQRDTLGYYTRAFLRVYTNSGQATSADPVEQALAKAFIQDSGATLIKRASIPQLLYRDGTLGVFFPPSSTPVSYSVSYGGAAKTIRVDQEGLFFPLDAALHPELVVQRNDGERVLGARLWPDQASNRLLIFSVDGRLRASGKLGQEEVLELAPGQYLALCRFEPTSPDGWEEVNETPRLVEVPITVRAGTETRLENGPASITIVGHNLPTFAVSGYLKTSLEHVEFRYAALTASVTVPAEWRQGAEQNFELRLVCDNARTAVIVQLASDGIAEIDIAHVIRNFAGVRPGLRRVVIELARSGEVRALQRQSILYWAGLESISYGLRFCYSLKPQNLMASSCSGLKVEDRGAAPASDQGRLVRLAFDMGSGRSMHLTWHRPGIYVEVEIPGAEGSTAVVPRPLGATESVSINSGKRVIVSASEPGYITLGTMRTYVDFGQRPSKVLPASFLASRIEPGSNVLTYETASGGASSPLLVLSQPHVAANAVAKRIDKLVEVSLSIAEEATEVVVVGKDLTSNRQWTVETQLMAGSWSQDEAVRLQAFCSGSAGKYILHVLIDLESLAPGVWTFTFSARIAGVWGCLEDASEGRIAIALAIESQGQELTPTEALAELESVSVDDAAVTLARVSDHFLQHWSPSCWELQGWLAQYFSALIDKVRDHEAECLTQLTDAVIARPNDDVRAGFFPHLSVGASLNQVFAQPRRAYKKVNTKHHPLSIALQAMGDMRSTLIESFGEVIHPAVAFSFKNTPEIMRGGRPHDFQLSRYREALVQTQLEGAWQLDDEQFLPSRGELLGPLHLAHAWRDLERGYARSLLMGSPRKNAAIAVARLLKQRCSTFNGAFPSGLREQSPLLYLAKRDLECADDAEILMVENTERIANACAWLAWNCRLQVRQEESLKGFHATLAGLRKQVEVVGPSVSDCIAFYLHVAPAMFAYYLLLWELVQSVELDVGVHHV